MPANTITKKSFFVRYRALIILFGILIFLPPLSLLFQFTQDSNFCGTWCPRMFFVWRKGMTGNAFLTGMIRSYMGVALVGGILATTFFFGRYWCSHLCPVGGSMEMSSRIVPQKLKINFSGIPAPFFRYGYFAVFMALPLIGLGSLCCNYCNFATVPRMFGAAFSQADMAYFFRNAGLVNLGLVVVLGVLAKGGRGYCNLLCPIGALDALPNRFGLKWGKRVSINPSRCNGCRMCVQVCPTWSIEMKNGNRKIDQLSCIPCRECEKVCPKEAISYGKVLS